MLGKKDFVMMILFRISRSDGYGYDVIMMW